MIAFTATAVVALAGFVLLTAAPSPGLVVVGIVLLAGALLVAVIFIVRLGRRSLGDREHEARAREVFDQTGSWPGELPR
jgi:hypothetical protein